MYHLNLVPADADMKDVAADSYGDSMKREMQNKYEVVLSDADAFSTSDEKDVVGNNVFRNSISVKVIARKDGNSGMDVWPRLLGRCPD